MQHAALLACLTLDVSWLVGGEARTIKVLLKVSNEIYRAKPNATTMMTTTTMTLNGYSHEKVREINQIASS